MSGLRALITELRPPVLDELGAKAAIEALAERVGTNGLIVDATVELAYESGRAAQRHTSELELTMYRIVQEALTNAVKNGRATRGVVEVIEGARTIEVSVRDDGAGFDPTTRTEGFGVLGMRERAALLHGTLEIQSAPGQGTKVSCTLPVQRRLEPGMPGAAASSSKRANANRSATRRSRQVRPDPFLATADRAQRCEAAICVRSHPRRAVPDRHRGRRGAETRPTSEANEIPAKARPRDHVDGQSVIVPGRPARIGLVCSRNARRSTIRSVRPARARVDRGSVCPPQRSRRASTYRV